MATEMSSIEQRWWRLRAQQLELSMAAASSHIGITAEQLTAIEITGDVTALTDEQIRRAAELYDVSIGFLRGS